MGARSGEGAPSGLRVLRLRRRAAPGHERAGVPPVRLQPLGEPAGRLHGAGQDGGPDPGGPQAEEHQGGDAEACRLPRQALSTMWACVAEVWLGLSGMNLASRPDSRLEFPSVVVPRPEGPGEAPGVPRDQYLLQCWRWLAAHYALLGSR